MSPDAHSYNTFCLMASSSGVCDAIVENLNGLAALAKPKVAWRNIGQDPWALRVLERHARSSPKNESECGPQRFGTVSFVSNLQQALEIQSPAATVGQCTERYPMRRVPAV